MTESYNDNSEFSMEIVYRHKRLKVAVLRSLKCFDL